MSRYVVPTIRAKNALLPKTTHLHMLSWQNRALLTKQWVKNERKCHMALCVHKVSFTWNSESNDLRTPCLHIEAPPVTLVPTGGRKLGQQNMSWADLCQCLCYPLSCLACLILHKIMFFTAHQVLLGTANDLLCKEVNFNMNFKGLVYSL